MSCLVPDADVLVLERRRHERIVHARRERATTQIEDGLAVPAYALREERRRVLAADAWVASGDVDVESADPLGVWSCGAPRTPRCWPGWRVVADWAAWSVLCLLAIGYLAMR